MELNLSQKQTQTLSPQMMQSMEILQMGSQELLEYIEEAVQENPVLEPEESYDKQDEFSTLQRKLEWLESTDPQNRYYHQQDTEEEDSPLKNYGTVEDDDENLYYYVLSQLKVLELAPEVMDAARTLVKEGSRAYQAAKRAAKKRPDFVLEDTRYKRSRHPDAPEDDRLWLDQRSLCLIRDEGDIDALFNGALAERLSDDFRAMAPVYGFFMAAYDRAPKERMRLGRKSSP